MFEWIKSSRLYQKLYHKLAYLFRTDTRKFIWGALFLLLGYFVSWGIQKASMEQGGALIRAAFIYPVLAWLFVYLPTLFGFYLLTRLIRHQTARKVFGRICIGLVIFSFIAVIWSELVYFTGIFIGN